MFRSIGSCSSSGCRGYRITGVIGVVACLAATGLVGAEETKAPAGITLENDFVRYDIGADGRNLHFVDKASGIDYCDAKTPRPVAHVIVGNQNVAASSAARQGDRLRVGFGQTGVAAVFKPIVKPRYVILEVESVEGQGVVSMSFPDLILTSLPSDSGRFAACAMALNLKTNVATLPAPSSHLTGACYARFGLAGAAVALVGCPSDRMRDVMKEVVSDAPDLPHSSVGGPWAMDAPAARGSYLFNFGGMTDQNAGEWAAVARDLGVNQIDFHGGSSFRFGDCRPNPQTYPKGHESLKAVIDRLHAAGILAGLHTYAFFIDKTCPWVTPKPDPRLASFRSFTLTGDLSDKADTVSVAESTADVSTVTGFFVRNSVTLRIDDELITFTGVRKASPFGFTGCRRGALGTKASAHATGTKACHLKECFGLFVPDPNTTMLAEVAAKTAEAYNACGFDMIYLDALDGEDILGGGENAWHYGSSFVFEIFKRLKKHPLMEMSTFHHHLWYVRSRLGAWDHPTRGHKAFIDIHCQANEECGRMFLPAHLGWWGVKTWTGADGEPTFSDDIEYLMSKCLGHNVGFSVMGIDPQSIKGVPAYRRLGAIMRQYEDLRHANAFNDTVRSELRKPGAEHTLVKEADGRFRFHRVTYLKHKVEGVNGWSNVWSVRNPYEAQPLRLRIETLLGAGPYDAAGNPTLADFADVGTFDQRAAASGLTVGLTRTTEQVKAGGGSAVLTAANEGGPDRRGAWAKVGRSFTPPMDMSNHRGLGLWVHGDGSGATFNVQLTSPHHLAGGIGDHYVCLDFSGWRYVELIEPESERFGRYVWPYGNPYAIYREDVEYRHIASLGLWLNELAPKSKTTCLVSPIRALPLVSIKVKNPRITIGGKTVTFPAEIESGSYLESGVAGDCKLYGPKGALIAEIRPQGDVPSLSSGDNRVTFDCDPPAGANARVRVTLIFQGGPI